MFLSAIHVVEKSANRLVVVSPPYYWIGLIFLAVGLFVLIAALSPASAGDKTKTNTTWIGVAVAAPFLLAAMGQLTSSTRIVVERDTQIFRLEARTFGFTYRATTIPLNQMQRVAVESRGIRAQALSARLRNGQIIHLTGATTQSGYGEAAHQLNQFIGRPD
jgi:hypothetical protein